MLFVCLFVKSFAGSVLLLPLQKPITTTSDWGMYGNLGLPVTSYSPDFQAAGYLEAMNIFGMYGFILSFKHQ